MPELPEVQKTVNGLKKVLPGLKIEGVWTDLAVRKPALRHFDSTLKNINFYRRFCKEVIGQKITKVERRAKNILIFLPTGKIILIHMKMTGNLLYGHYTRGDKFIHAVFDLSNNKQLALRDVRKFGKITLLDQIGLKKLAFGPEPLDKNFQFSDFESQLMKKSKGRIKTVLMDQSIIAGVGNIYSDEILWRAGVHPEAMVANIPDVKLKLIFRALKETLRKGIDFGGDSTSDYRNIYDREGKFQLHHKAYQRAGEKCAKIGCKGIIIRKIIGGRSAHFCPEHQKIKWTH